jgi:hypothetical protein
MKFGKHNQKGSMLIQIMASVAVLASIVFGVMNYTSSNIQENISVQAQSEINSAAQLLSALASEPEMCNTRVFLRNNFNRPANPVTDAATEQDLAVNIGLDTNARPNWVDPLMGANAPASLPGLIQLFDMDVPRITIRNARLKNTLSSGRELWSGELMMYAQKPAVGTRAAIGGKRIVANIELEVNSAGAKVNCRTTTSVASVCRDLGGVYDPNGVPNCLFALADMSCGNGPNDYIHDIVNGVPVCRTAGNNCLAPNGLPGNYYAIGVTNGILECRRLTRRVVAGTPTPPPPPPIGPTCPAGTSTAGLGGAAAPTGCLCNNAGETWNSMSCVTAPINKVAIGMCLDGTLIGQIRESICNGTMCSGQTPDIWIREPTSGQPLANNEDACFAAGGNCWYQNELSQNDYGNGDRQSNSQFCYSNTTSFDPTPASSGNINTWSSYRGFRRQ